MAAETQYTANTGIVQISTANSNLDGTGTIGNLITGASNGTLIKTVSIKALVSTTFGMIRFFVYNGTITKLIKEVNIPAITKSYRNPSFEITIPLDYFLGSRNILKVSTEKAETFNIIAEGLDWVYYTTSVRPESAKYTANTGLVAISTANPNLDGTGTIGNVLIADANGTIIQSVIVKSQVSTNPGMVRIYIYNGDKYPYLLTEVPIPSVTKSGTAHSFSHRIDFGGLDFALQSEFILKASTENAQAFNVIAEGLDWEYPA
ncbi:MAG: hypothetical protein ABIJ97_00135 [Bacteroidota bacterium]